MPVCRAFECDGISCFRFDCDCKRIIFFTKLQKSLTLQMGFFA